MLTWVGRESLADLPSGLTELTFTTAVEHLNNKLSETLADMLPRLKEQTTSSQRKRKLSQMLTSLESARTAMRRRREPAGLAAQAASL